MATWYILRKKQRPGLLLPIPGVLSDEGDVEEDAEADDEADR